MRTFHYHLYVFDQPINNVKSLSGYFPGLLDGESVEPLKNCFDIVIP